ncbi:hypothetical protein ACSBR1_001231 [Camellia fascicularis]
MASSSQRMQLQLINIIIMLLLQLQLVVVVLVVVVLPSSSSSSSATAAPPTIVDLENLGCWNRCGDVSIPYPFGVKSKCYLNEDFLISCNQSNPYFQNRSITVSNITLEVGELRIMQQLIISRDCYDQRLGTPLQSNFNASLILGKFSISRTKNKFTAIGCDTYANLGIYKNDSSVLSTACVSQCVDKDYVSNGTCSGIGCCQTSIPKGVSHIDINVSSFSNHKNVLDFNPCSYAFIIEERAFNFSTTYLEHFGEEKVPMVLDWGIGDNETCEQAKRNPTSYACGQNSDCHNATNVGGYICKCLSGYKGNPYLDDGCQDINECEQSNLNICGGNAKCVNTPGNYTCTADSLIETVTGVCSGVGALFLLIASWWL